MITIHDKLKRLPADRRKKIETRAQELISEEMSLRDLRKALELTQEHMAEILHIRQEGVSRLEKRSDLLISTLRTYVEAMGGELKLIVKFPKRTPIVLQGLGEIEG
jgi:DNA-binding XRE family transcriptional regulator